MYKGTLCEYLKVQIWEEHSWKCPAESDVVKGFLHPYSTGVEPASAILGAGNLMIFGDTALKNTVRFKENWKHLVFFSYIGYRYFVCKSEGISRTCILGYKIS